MKISLSKIDIFVYQTLKTLNFILNTDILFFDSLFLAAYDLSIYHQYEWITLT